MEVYSFGVDHGLWGSDAAVVSGGMYFADTLAASPLADKLKAPVFFVSSDGWMPAVLCWDVNKESGEATQVGEDSCPAATSDGCICASDPDYQGSGTFYGSMSSWDGSSSSEVFSIEPKEGTWGISGVWASSAYRVVGLSSDDASHGSYLGVWNADFSRCLGWDHIASPRAVCSLNDSYFVCGVGSEAENAQMYALRLDEMALSVLRSLPKYPRPSIAAHDNAAMLPVSNGGGAVSYGVVSLG